MNIWFCTIIKNSINSIFVNFSFSIIQIKLGDFGLATKVDYDGERKRTLCGTPNYIAPEVLTKKGSYNTIIAYHKRNFIILIT